MLEFTSPDSLSLIIGALAGIGGLATIHHFVVRPRVYSRNRSWDVVQSADPGRKKRTEQVLANQRMPTATLELLWWNEGRRSAKDIVLDVEVPGVIWEWEMSPKNANDVAAPWTVLNDPRLSGEPARLRIQQPQLRPRTYCKLLVGWHPDGSSKAPKVRIYQGDRTVRSELGVRFAEAGAFMGAFGFVLGYFVLPALGTVSPQPRLAVGLGLGAGMAVIGIFMQAHDWEKYERRLREQFEKQ